MGKERAILFFPDFGPGEETLNDYTKVHSIGFFNRQLYLKIDRSAAPPPAADYILDRHLQVVTAIPEARAQSWIQAHRAVIGAGAKSDATAVGSAYLRKIVVLKNEFQ